MSRCERWRAGKATNTIKKIRPAIASTSTTSMIVKPFLVVDIFLVGIFILSLFINFVLYDNHYRIIYFMIL